MTLREPFFQMISASGVKVSRLITLFSVVINLSLIWLNWVVNIFITLVYLLFSWFVVVDSLSSWLIPSLSAAVLYPASC